MTKKAKLLILVFSLAPFLVQATTVDALKNELKDINEELIEAIDKSSRYNKGLIKNVVESRIEILKINAALIKQRIHSVESGAKINIVIDSVKPDLLKVTEIESEILFLMSEIKKKEIELSKYNKGLLKVLVQSNIASLEHSISILRLELLKAKYGITWIPKVDVPSKASHTEIGKDINKIKYIASDEKIDASDDTYSLIKPMLFGKRFEDEVWDKNIWFDILWIPVNLKKDTRAVKGILIFEDIFGEEKFRIGRTINDSINAKSGLMEFGIGFEYNDFKSSHRWVRTTDFKDMKFKFKVEDIIYKKTENKHSLEEEIQTEEDKERHIAQEDIINELKTNYINQIAARVRDKWRFNGGKDYWGCDVYILQDINGKVEMVNVQSCSVDDSSKEQAFKNSIERAIYKASPLPVAPDKRVFNKEILFRFRVN